MEEKNKRVIIISIIALSLILITVSYAYFSARITGLESASTISMNAGRMEINYAEGDEAVSAPNMYPREEAWITKTFTLTGYNTTNQTMKYDIGLNVITNTFPNTYLTYDLRVLDSDGGTPAAEKIGAPINGTGMKKIGKGTFTSANGDAHEYEIKIYFKDNGLNQNDAQGAIFNAKVYVEENNSPVNECTYNGDLVQGAEYKNGQYTYRYMQQGIFNGWEDIEEDGWGVKLTYSDSTTPVTTKLCTSINGKPIVSMQRMFQNSQATTLDLSSFDTSDVTNMSYMFYGSAATTLDLSFFDTSNVTNMSYMFHGSAATTLDLSSFATSNVTDMNSMFLASAATTLDLSSFATSNVTNMGSMFQASAATTLDLSSFDTSNVTSMYGMFWSSHATTLDLSSFDTSNVTNMGSMFRNASNLTTIYVSSEFTTNSVTNSSTMFTGATNLVGGLGTTYSANFVSKTRALIDGGTNNPGYFTNIADKTN